MPLWIWIGLFVMASVVSWLILLPRPNNQNLDLLEKFLPLIVGVFGVLLVVRGFWPYGLGLLVFFFGTKIISKRVNNQRLARLNNDAKRIEAEK